MLRRNYSLILMALWLAMAAALFAPELVLPDRVRAHLRGPGGAMAGTLALVFAAYNLARWWAARALAQRDTRPNPLAHQSHEPEPYQPNPDLNFLRVPDADRPADETRPD